MSAGSRAERAAWKTALGLVLTGVMLFPLYWMINVSLTERGAIRDAELYPRAFTLEHYRVVLGDQLPYLRTSLVVGIGKIVRELSPEEIEKMHHNTRHYVERARQYKQGLKKIA